MPEPGSGRSVLATTFERLRAGGRRAFIPYVTAGHPAPDATVEVLQMLAGEGADDLYKELWESIEELNR